MAVSDEQIEEIRAKVDIADLVSSYGFQLKQSGGTLWCCCPFHQEKTPSFKVDSSRGTFHCFGCGESGDVFSFVQKQEGLSFMEAVGKLADRTGVELKQTISPTAKLRRRLYELMANLAIDFNRMLCVSKDKDSEVAREYLRSRDLGMDIASKFLIGYAPKDVDKILAWAEKHNYTTQELASAGIIKLSDSLEKKPYFYFSNRLVFSIKDKNGQVVAFSGRQLVEDKKSGKYVNSPETLIFKKSRTFFAFDEARKHIVKDPHREAIICEGQIDCIRLHASGYNTAIAPLGTAFTEDHAVMLHRVADTALLCFDDDEAGHKATIKAAQILLAEGMPVRVVSLPNGDDPDSYIRRNGAVAFGKLIETASESIVKFQIRAEKSKEVNPNDPNVSIRVSKAVLSTIAKCKDPVLRDVLLKEAAICLGIGYAALLKDLENKVESEKEAADNDVDALIEKPIPHSTDKVQAYPNITEGALLNFLFSNEGDRDVHICLEKLIPLAILKSPTTKKIIAAWMKGRDETEDHIRTTIESLSIEEYRTFIAIISNMDSTDFASISKKKMMAYFARQLWHEYLMRLLRHNQGDKDRMNELGRAISILHNASVKDMAKMIGTFPHNRFNNAA